MFIDYEKIYGRKERGQIFPHLPLRTQRSWIDSDLVESSGESYDGRGLKREFKLEHLLQLTLVEQLNGLNLPHNVIRNIMDTYFFGLIEIDRSKYPNPPPGDKLPKILDNIGHFLVIFHGAGFNRDYAKEDVWKATLVPSGELPAFFSRFLNTAEDDVLMHATKFGLHENPIATILVNLQGVQERLFDYMNKAGISPFKPL